MIEGAKSPTLLVREPISLQRTTKARVSNYPSVRLAARLLFYAWLDRQPKVRVLSERPAVVARDCECLIDPVQRKRAVFPIEDKRIAVPVFEIAMQGESRIAAQPSNTHTSAFADD